MDTLYGVKKIEFVAAGTLETLKLETAWTTPTFSSRVQGGIKSDIKSIDRSIAHDGGTDPVKKWSERDWANSKFSATLIEYDTDMLSKILGGTKIEADTEHGEGIEVSKTNTSVETAARITLGVADSAEVYYLIFPRLKFTADGNITGSDKEVPITANFDILIPESGNIYGFYKEKV